MTALDMITTLRICGNHSSMDGKECSDCPYLKECDMDPGGSNLYLDAANVIEALMKELAAARAGMYRG